MVTRLRAILSTLRPSCLHNQPYRWGTRCGPLAWSRGGSLNRIKARSRRSLRFPVSPFFRPLLSPSRRRGPPSLSFDVGAGVSVSEFDSEIYVPFLHC